MAKPCRRGSVGVACMAARVQGAFPAGCHKTQAVPGGNRGRPYGGDGSAAVQTAFPNHRTLHERPLTRRGPMKASAPTTESLPGTFDRGFSRKHFGKIPLLAY